MPTMIKSSQTCVRTDFICIYFHRRQYSATLFNYLFAVMYSLVSWKALFSPFFKLCTCRYHKLSLLITTFRVVCSIRVEKSLGALGVTLLEGRVLIGGISVTSRVYVQRSKAFLLTRLLKSHERNK